ncbi:hypothetical protein J5H43_01765 [Stenotrophomonas maltophilia]|uniref:hypothetical protein n=1 Tax=Stenotrophomonas maltophilia TaxID=40324 RepID=UPI001AAEC874|nr:hypothetical protein [Stenotrophomonas maltophilia]MBO3002240.1 hypothetical protein [Stenotrophomonas maltophilia]MBP1381616.1 hypothetical protein [Stenotrophomonas maltophilia]MBP1386628.1 hypothetical protein [Stenotrophomonas maltophilia]
MSVTGGSGTNNSARTVCSVVGGTIRLAGGGGKVGHSGFTACPAVLQPESARAQAISDSRAFRFSICLLLLVLGGHCLGPLDPLALDRDHGDGVVALLLCNCLGRLGVVPSALGLSHCPALPHGDACQEQYSSQQDTGQDAHISPAASVD